MFTGTLRQAKRTIIGLVGFTVIMVGVVMLVTPGPGWLVIAAGLSILAIEFVWARRLLRRLRERGGELGDALFGKLRSRFWK